MYEFWVMVANPKPQTCEIKEKLFQWPALPRTGESIDLSADGTGLDGKVESVMHRIGTKRIELAVSVSTEFYQCLIKQDGWR